MDRGDTGFIIHESFKDLKARRAEQEAYRKALEEQIMQKRKLQEKEKQGGRKLHTPLHTPKRNPDLPVFPTSRIQPSGLFAGKLKQETPDNYTPQDPSVHEDGHSTSFSEFDGYNEPHPAGAVVTTPNGEEKHKHDFSPSSSNEIPQFSPECIKYLQQVMPGFTPPPISAGQSDHRNSTKTVTPNINTTNLTSAIQNTTGSQDSHFHTQAFSSGESGTTSESSSVENIQFQPMPAKPGKIHVSQTSEQLEGVKVSRKQYREELQKQIDERRRRQEELRRKAQEEEERIQEKIRIEQEKMQREYEEELRKQEEREKEAENKRLASLAKPNEIAFAGNWENMKGIPLTQATNFDNTDQNINASASEDNIQSICDFFDETMKPSSVKKYIDPDERIIPVVAKRLMREQSLQKDVTPGEQNETENVKDGVYNPDKITLTARIDSAFSDKSGFSQNEGPPPPCPGVIREMAIRSAPCLPTTPTDLEFLSTLKNYLQNEKEKIDERIQAKTSKSNERF